MTKQCIHSSYTITQNTLETDMQTPRYQLADLVVQLLRLHLYQHWVRSHTNSSLLHDSHIHTVKYHGILGEQCPIIFQHQQVNMKTRRSRGKDNKYRPKAVKVKKTSTPGGDNK